VSHQSLSTSTSVSDADVTAGEALPQFWHFLPGDVLVKIFSNLDIVTLLKGASLVCQTWNNAARDPLLYHRIAMDGSFGGLDENSCQHLHALLDRASEVEHLSLCRWDSIDMTHDILEEESTENVKTLLIDFSTCTRLPVDTFMQFLTAQCPYITALSLAGVRNLGDEPLATVLDSFVNIEHLDLSYCPRVTDEGFIARKEKSWKLRTLRLDECPFVTDLGVSAIMRLYPSLREITLDGENITSDGLLPIRQAERINSFSLSFSAFHDNDILEILCNESSMIQRIQKLRLKKAPYLSPLVLENALLIGAPFQIQFLDLTSWEHLSTEAVQVVARTCPDLSVIKLSWCIRVGDAAMLDLVKNCLKLEEMVLIGMKGLDGSFLGSALDIHTALAAPMKPLDRCRLIDLTQCNSVDDTIIHRAVRLLPFLTVVDYYGNNFGFREEEDIRSTDFRDFLSPFK